LEFKGGVYNPVKKRSRLSLYYDFDGCSPSSALVEYVQLVKPNIAHYATRFIGALDRFSFSQSYISAHYSKYSDFTDIFKYAEN